MLQERDYPPPPPSAYDYYYEDEGRRRGGGGRRYSAEHDNRTRGPVIDVDQDLTDEDDEVPSVRGAGARSFENFRVTIKNSDDKGATKTASKKAKKSSKANKPVSVSSGDGTPR